MTDAEAVETLVRDLVDRWNAREIPRVVALFAEDAVYVSGAGLVAQGRTEIERLLSDAQPVTIRLDDSPWIRMHGAAATAIIRWTAVAAPPEGRSGITSIVAVPVRGVWRIAQVQNTDVA